MATTIASNVFTASDSLYLGYSEPNPASVAADIKELFDLQMSG
jgi:hypothetical protein